MRRRCCIEWLGHKEIRVTNLCHQKVLNPTKLTSEIGLDLITMKMTNSADTPILELLRYGGTGNLGDAVQLNVMARTKEGGRDRIKGFTIYDGPQIIEVDFPEEKPRKR